MMHTITSALQCKRTFCLLSHGKEIPLHPEFAVCLTTSSISPPWQLPPTLSPMFRTFSLPLPDPTIIFRAHCTALGLRSPKSLANKLTTLYTMARDQLSASCVQAGLSLSTLCFVLSVASQRQQVTSVASKAVKLTLEHASTSEIHGHTQSYSGGRSPAHDLKSRKTASLMMSPSIGQPLPPATHREHSMVAQLLLTILGSRLPDQQLPVFTSMVSDVFAVSATPVSSQPPLPVLPSGLMTPTASGSPLAQSDLPSVVASVKRLAKESGLIPTHHWVSKVEQLLTLACLKHAVVVAGRPATGKSAALRAVLSALNSPSSSSGSAGSVKVVRIYPGTFEDLSTVFGHVSEGSGDWVDGVFTCLYRKAHKAVKTVTWVCFDGCLHTSWTHFLTELTGPSKVMSLPNGEHLFMNERNLKLIFETGCLDSASPSMLINCGVVYFDSSVLGWRPVVESWMIGRRANEVHCLQRHFEAVLDPVIDFVLHKSNRGSAYSEVGLMETCLAYLTPLLDTYMETAEVFSDVHVERLLLFSVIWSYGGVLTREVEQRKFSHLLKGLTNSLPDDDSDYLVFDYYVDESGEWDVWQSRLPEQPMPTVDLFGRVFVDTPQTARVELLLDLALSSRRHVVLAGPDGSGKTSVTRHFLHSRALTFSKTENVKQLVLSGHTTSSLLHHFMQVNFHHRQGYTYGPKHGRMLELFIDDLHLPLRHTASVPGSVCPPHEYLRQLMDGGGLHNLCKPNDWAAIEDLVVFGAVTSNRGNVQLDPRLLHHFATIHLPDISKEDLKVITSQILQALTIVPGAPATSSTSTVASPSQINHKTLEGIITASLEVYGSVREALKVSDVPGRWHYVFSLSQLESVFEGLSHRDALSTPRLAIGASWSHEMKRAFTGGLCRTEDTDWLSGHINSLSLKYLPMDDDGEDGGEPPLALSAIPTELKQGEEQPASTVSPLSVMPEVTLHPLGAWSDLEGSLSDYMRRYKEDVGPLTLQLSTNNIPVLVKLHRALKFTRGHSILVGSLGQPLRAIASFALYIAGYTLHPLDTSRPTTFTDGLRGLFRQAGLDGRPVGVVISEKDLAGHSVAMLQTVASIVACGELPTLFSNDEMDGLLQALGPAMKRDFPSEQTDPMQYFTARIYRNLRLVLCLSPTAPILNDLAHDFKGLLHSSQLIYMRDWTQESLSNTVQHFFSENPLPMEIERAPLYNCLQSIHHLMMREAGQLKHVGLQPPPLRQQQEQNMQEATPPPTVSTTTAPRVSSDESGPSSFKGLMEKLCRMTSKLDTKTQQNLEVPYIGPRTYAHFLECFSEMFRQKSSDSVTERTNLSKALESLGSTRREVEVTREHLGQLKQQHEAASKLSQELLTKLTAKACQLERLRALLGEGSAVLSAIRMVSEQERQMVENEEDDEELLSMLAEGLGNRTSLLDVHLDRAREAVAAAEQEESEAQRALTHAKEQAHLCESRIDRNTIDKIKSLKNPPRLVSTIMELMLTLLRQFGVGSSEHEHGGTGHGSGESTPGHVAMHSAMVKRRHSQVPGQASEAAHLEKEHWLSIQLAIGDSQNFLDLLSSLKWEDGLSTDAINLIESKISTKPGASLARKGVNSSGSASTTSKGPGESFTEQQQQLITMDMAKHAAGSAAIMCAYAIAIVEYQHSFQSYRVALKKLERARQALQALETSPDQGALGVRGNATRYPDLEDVTEEETEMGEEDLERLGLEVKELQAQFDRAVMEKHSVGQNCQQLAEKLKSANRLLESLEGRLKSWQAKMASLPSQEVLLGNCIVAAAVTTYCGPLRTSDRHRVFSSLVALCRLSGLGSAQGSLLSLSSYPCFVLGEPSLYHLTMEGLPKDPTSQQTATIILHPHTRRWPLVVDQLCMVEQWLRSREKDAVFVKHKSRLLPEEIARCMDQGRLLVITEVDTVSLAADKAVMDAVRCCGRLRRAKHKQKLMIGDKEIDCSPSFRLCLVTPSPVHQIPTEVCPLVSLLLFHPERQGVAELLLDRFLELQNPKTSSERVQLREEIHKQAVRLQQVEEELLVLLSQQHSPQLEDNRVTKAILALNTAYEDSQESLNQALARYSTMEQVHLATLHSLASQASVMMDVVMAMGSLRPTYHTSYGYMESVFLSFIEQAGSRLQGEDALHRMTQLSYEHFLRGYFERDRLLFSLMLALEIERSHERGSCNERDFLMCPFPGRQFAIKGLAAALPTSDAGGSGAVLSFGKKPFDWISETQWQMLLMLASHFSWIHEILERLNKDGKECVWRTIGEGVAPETINLAEGIGYKLSPLRQLLIMQAMRPERLTQAMVSFVVTVLQQKHKRLNYDAPIELQKVSRGLRSDQIPLLLYKHEPHLPLRKLQQLACKAKVPLTVLWVHGTGSEEIHTVKQSIEHSRQHDQWLLLHNIHTNPELLQLLPSLLAEGRRAAVHEEEGDGGEGQRAKGEKWRVWLAAHKDARLPTAILQVLCKVALDSPKSVRASLLHSLSSLGGDILSTSNRPEWLPLLHNLAMFHATLRPRGAVYDPAWSTDYLWTHTHLTDIVDYVVKEFQSSEVLQPGLGGVRPISWSGIRYMISEVFYGALVSDASDYTTLAALTDHWVHPGGQKREAGRYHTPSQFFVPGTRLPALMSAVEHASPPLVFTAEMCGLYFTQQVKLGWNDYLLAQLSLLCAYVEHNTKLPSTSTDTTVLAANQHTSSLPAQGNAASTEIPTQISGTTSTRRYLLPAHRGGGTLAPPTDRLPSFIQVASQIGEVSLAGLSTADIQSLLTSSHGGPLRELLSSTVKKLAENIPTGWKKDVLSERVRKHGKDTPFGLFITTETSRMTESLMCIHSSLQDLAANVLTSTSLSSSKGDPPLDSPHLVDLSLALLTLTVPRCWQEIVGVSSPPGGWPLKEWIQDLVLRYTFLDRVLVGGLSKTPTYWLGAFFNPEAFLSLVQQNVVRSLCVKSGAVEQFVFQAELTNRDKDHIRDPPPEGELFIYGIHLWGCGFEKAATLELRDIPPKSQVPSSLPLIHLTLSPKTEPASAAQLTDPKSPSVFQCPCFASCQSRVGRSGDEGGKPLFFMNVSSSDVIPGKWAMRNLVCTLRPF